MKKNIFFISIFVILIIPIFKSLLQLFPISGGDYIIFWPENIKYLKDFPFFSWDSTVGLGYNSVGLIHEAPYNYFLGWVGQVVGYKTVLWERLGWWLPFFVLSFFSTKILFRYLYPKNNFWIFSPFIFMFNTYVLMMLGGGQIAGIGLAYAIAPLILWGFIQLTTTFLLEKNFHSTLKSSIIAGLLFSIQVMFDLRIAYITLIAVGLYVVLSIRTRYKSFVMRLSIVFFALVIPVFLTFLLHVFWILPTLVFKVNTIQQLGSAFNSPNAVKFFSFATFENSLSLLHPNWPENIFGKIYFMRPEFLILPILAFTSLLLSQRLLGEGLRGRGEIRERTLHCIFFAFLALIGAFLAKGANDPFGQVYLWMFGHIPGFIMFRDASKFYVLIALSYSVLIPVAIGELYEKISQQKKNGVFNAFAGGQGFQNAFLILVVIYLLFLIQPALTGKLTGTFQRTLVPNEYVQLREWLTSQKDFSRTLWIPTTQRFKFTSPMHPAIAAQDFFQNASLSGVLTIVREKQTEQLLEDAGVGYIIVPDDTEKEIFLKNQNYNIALYNASVKIIANQPWVAPVKHIGHIAIFQVLHPKDHFWILNSNAGITYKAHSPTSYTVTIKHAKKNDKLIFSEAFDPFWSAKINSSERLVSNRYEQGNSFMLPKEGDYSLTIYYEPQRWVNIGLWISMLTLVSSIAYCVLYRRRG